MTTVKVSITLVDSMVSPGVRKDLGLFNMATNLAGEVALITGGASNVTSEGWGTWNDAEGKAHSEKNRIVFTYTDEGNIPALREVAIRWRDMTDQLCVMFTIEPVITVEFL